MDERCLGRRPGAKAVIDDDYDRVAAGRRGELNIASAMKAVVVDESASSASSKYSGMEMNCCYGQLKQALVLFYQSSHLLYVYP